MVMSRATKEPHTAKQETGYFKDNLPMYIRKRSFLHDSVFNDIHKEGTKIDLMKIPVIIFSLFFRKQIAKHR
jgi:hypothetical protein